MPGNLPRGNFRKDIFLRQSLTHSLTHFPLTSRCTPSVCMTSSLQSFPPFTSILTVSARRFHYLKSSLIAFNQHFFGRARLLFPSTSKSKIYPVHSSLRFTCPNQCSLYHLNTESKLFSFNRLRREFVLTRCSFLMLHNHVAQHTTLQTFLIFLSEGPTF